VRTRCGPAAAAGAALALLTEVALNRWAPGGDGRWQRTNHRGVSVSLLSGPALAVGATLTSGLPGAAAVAAGWGAGAVGRFDDAVGGADGTRGVRGHAAALRRGRITTGSLKVVGIGAAGVLSAALLPGRQRLPDLVVNAGLVAGSANMVNLLDLRPGRALKAVLLASVALDLPGPAGAAAALLPADLRERSMLGDAGANSSGALLGLAVAHRLAPRSRRTAVLGLILALTAISERVSYSRIIEATPLLHWWDRLGRLP